MAATTQRRRNLGEELIIFGNPNNFRVEHVAKAPRGWKIRTKKEGTHLVRIAFPQGRRQVGAGQLVEVLHPRRGNPCCEEGTCPILADFSAANPFASFASQAAANKQKAAWEKQGYQVSIHPMHGGTFAVLATKRKANPRRGRRRNQAEDVTSDTDQAVRLFQKFHGKEPAEILDVQRSAAIRLDYAALGDLRGIGLGPAELHGTALVNGWETLNNLDFAGENVKLASAPNGRQLYLIGGNQDMDPELDGFEGVDPEKDLIDLGEVGFVVYEARKKHAGFEPIEYVHELGEETGELPRLMYDRLKHELFFVGGEYFIDLEPALSPGIEN
jgi:hypothetical protein